MTFRYCGFTDEAGRALDTQIAVLQEVGWTGIEPRFIGDGNVCDLTDKAWDETWSKLQGAGIAIAGFGGQIANWARPITSDFTLDLDELKRCAPRMKQAGTKILRIMSYPNAPDKPWTEAAWKQEVFRRLHELAKRAEDLGVILGHENCSGYGGIGPRQWREIAEAVRSPALKFIFDTGNATQHDNDGDASWRYYQAVKDEIVHVHIKAYKPGPDGKMVTCFPDEDPVQKRILADLNKRDYNGWVSIEPHLVAIAHAGKKADDGNAAYTTWVEYARRLERLAAEI